MYSPKNKLNGTVGNEKVTPIPSYILERVEIIGNTWKGYSGDRPVGITGQSPSSTVLDKCNSDVLKNARTTKHISGYRKDGDDETQNRCPYQTNERASQIKRNSDQGNSFYRGVVPGRLFCHLGLLPSASPTQRHVSCSPELP